MPLPKSVVVQTAYCMHKSVRYSGQPKGQLATKQITWVVGIFAVFSLTITRLSLNWPLEGKLIETVLYKVRRNREYGHTDNTLSSFFAARRFNNDWNFVLRIPLFSSARYNPDENTFPTCYQQRALIIREKWESSRSFLFSCKFAVKFQYIRIVFLMLLVELPKPSAALIYYNSCGLNG